MLALLLGTLFVIMLLQDDNRIVGSKENLYSMTRVLSRRATGLKICHINAQSLNNKMDEFRYIFEESDVDILCISESWFHPEIKDSNYELNGYRLFRADRYSNGGGAAIYAKSSICCKLICKSLADEKIEYLFLEILNNNNLKLLIGSIYKPNKDTDFSPLLNKLTTLTLGYTDVIIAGDFNENIFADRSLVDDMNAIGLVLVNCSIATHFTKTSSTLLDLYFINDRSKLLLFDQLSASMFSKHDIIFLSYDYNIKTQEQSRTIGFRDFKNLDYQSLESELSTISWNQVFLLPAVDEQLSFLQNNFLYLYEKYVPIKIRKIRNGKPWFCNEIKTLIAERNLAYERWKRFRTTELHNAFKDARRKVNSKIRYSKSILYKKRFESAVCSGKKWREIHNLGIVNGTAKIENAIDINQLNYEFTNIPMPEVSVNYYDNFSNTMDVDNDNSNGALCFNFKHFTQEDVLQSLLSIKSNSVGHDGIHPKFIKLIVTYTLPHITHLFNTIVTTSTFPSAWKHAKIIPIPKADNTFRPIAILPFLSKALERLIHTQMNHFLHENSLLSHKQSGFRPKHSCISALIEVSEELRANIDNSMVSFLILLDHSKAFDTVDFTILCQKLKNMFHFSPTAVKLIYSYLCNRSQSVYHGSDESCSYSTTRGVPQGSILGPLLYVLYANDLPSRLRFCGIHMYADDVQLFISCKPSEANNCITKINYDLDSIKEWASANGLCINARKSKAMLIGKIDSLTTVLQPILIGNSVIVIDETAKNLGVIFNKKLDWSNHINAVCGRTYAMLRNLWMSHYYTPLNIRMLLAKTYLLPTLLYGCELFASCDTLSMKRLNVTYNNIARYVFGRSRRSRISQYSRQICNISFDSLLKIRTLLFFHKVIYTKQPEYLHNRIIFSRSDRGNKINTFRFRKDLTKKHFFYNAINLWRQLPPNIQTISNARHFKIAIYKHLPQ